MLDDEALDYYYIYMELAQKKNDLKEFKNSFNDLKEQLEDIESNLLKLMISTNNKYVKIKDLELTLKEKQIKTKLTEKEIEIKIEEIINSDLETEEKRKNIQKILKPQNVGSKIYLNKKFKK